MVASIATLTTILKDFYLGPIQDQLNEEILALELFEKAKLDWSGRQVIIPVHLARNTGVGAAAEGAAGATLPVAGNQTFANLAVTARFVYGSFSLTGPAISSAGSGGANSFAGYVDAEMKRLVTDVKNHENRSAFSGQGHLGYVVGPDNAATVTLNFDGDYSRIADIQTALVAGGSTLLAGELAVTLRTVGDTTNLPDAYGNVLARSIIGFDPIARTITISVAADLTVAGAYGAASGATCGVWSVEVQAIGGQTAAFQALVQPTAALAQMVNEPGGIVGNLHSGNHFGINRTPTFGPFVAALGREMQCRSVRVPLTAFVGAGAQRAAVTARDLQNVMDLIDLESGEMPDILLTHPLTRQSYVAQLTQTMTNGGTSADSDGSNRRGDIGFGGQLSFAGTPVRTSRHCPQGLIFMLKLDGWKMCQLEAPGFADLDGNILSRVVGTDAWAGFYRHYYEIVACRPNSNGILAGVI